MVLQRNHETAKMPIPLDALSALRQVNDSLHAALVRMQPEQNLCSAITPQHFSDLISQIQRGSKCVSSLGADTADATQKEAAAYRVHLEALQQFLPDLHGRLLAEKSRLEAARDQAAATTAWVRASQKTM